VSHHSRRVIAIRAQHLDHGADAAFDDRGEMLRQRPAAVERLTVIGDLDRLVGALPFFALDFGLALRGAAAPFPLVFKAFSAPGGQSISAGVNAAMTRI
jgi:hypothetical protein